LSRPGFNGVCVVLLLCQHGKGKKEKEKKGFLSGAQLFR